VFILINENVEEFNLCVVGRNGYFCYIALHTLNVVTIRTADA